MRRGSIPTGRPMSVHHAQGSEEPVGEDLGERRVQYGFQRQPKDQEVRVRVDEASTCWSAALVQGELDQGLRFVMAHEDREIGRLSNERREIVGDARRHLQ